MKLRPNKFRNGIYIACIAPSKQMTNPEKELLENGEDSDENQEGNVTKNSSLTLEQNMNIKKKKKLKSKINKNIKNAMSTTSLRERKRRGKKR